MSSEFKTTSILVFSLVLMILVPCVVGAQTRTGPSQLCHNTDGSFTTCPNGGREWSDITPVFFQASGAYLYADQADLDPLKQSTNPVTRQVSPLDTFVLMYDECRRTTPLGPDEYFLVNFDTVEVEGGIEKLERYSIHIFTNNTLIFLENGIPQPDSSGRFRVNQIAGQRGDAGFGPSPTCPFDHVIVEFQIVLATAGGNSYSPDPIFWGGTPPVPPDCRTGETKVSTKVNVLSGVSITDDKIAELVTGMNGLLDQANTCADFDRAKIKRNVSDQGNNDGRVNRAERDKIRKDCVDELKNEFGGGKGFKLVFVTAFDDSATSTGISLHRPDIPCSLIRIDGNGGTLAHEFSHVFTLGPNHLIDDKDTPDPADDIRADAAGHSSDPNNLMFPEKSDTATKLTPDQIAEVRKGAKKRSSNTEHASWSDNIGDVSQGFIDLYIGSLFAENLASDLEISINLAGLYPSTADTNTLLELFFDTDNNSATGRPFGAFTGIDKILQISVSGRFPFTAPVGTVVARLVDLASNTVTPLPPGNVERVDEITDTGAISPASTAAGVLDSVNQNVPLPALGLTARRIPIGIRATNIATSEVDETSFFFDLSAGVGLGAIRTGFDSNALPRNDDGSTGLVPIGFPVKFFGRDFTSLFVNNNGDVTFDAPLPTFTPFNLTSTGRVIIAPFFADVDTRSAGDPVKYGAALVNGRSAFGASYINVDCFISSAARTARNFFQVILIDRSDISSGDFDIEFNYDQIQWETGQASGGNSVCQGGTSARVGFSNGSGVPGTFFELPGSGVVGAFLDSNLATGLIRGSLNSTQLGRYVFPVRNGTPSTERDTDQDGVTDDLDNCPTVVNPRQEDGDLNGIGDACQGPKSQHSTAGFLQARLDGAASLQSASLAVVEEPALITRIQRIVDFRVSAGLTDSAARLTANLLASLGEANLISPISIDITPGGFPNSINLSSNGKVPVAILSTPTFDATTVNRSSVVFAGVSALSIGGGVEDVNGDGRPDIVVHFSTPLLQLKASDTQACLIGQTASGKTVAGCDSVRIVGK